MNEKKWYKFNSVWTWLLAVMLVATLLGLTIGFAARADAATGVSIGLWRLGGSR